MMANCSVCQGTNLRNIVTETDYVSQRISYKLQCNDCDAMTTACHALHPKVEKIKTNCPKCYSHHGTVLTWYQYQKSLNARIQCDNCSYVFIKEVKKEAN